jgi:stearoyl-CoA desaturase (Delta-9 desaturase)
MNGGPTSPLHPSAQSARIRLQPHEWRVKMRELEPHAPPEAGLTRSRSLHTLRRWFDTLETQQPIEDSRADRIDWLRAAPFIVLHLGCLGAFWTGVSPVAITVAGVLYALRMFALTAFYHRCFSHRTFKAPRSVQFVFAVLGASCVQRGPLWWAAHHRHHHGAADTPRDPHSPRVHGFLWSHMGWFLTPRAFATDTRRVPDLARFPELRWLDRYDIAVPVLLATALYALGAALHRVAPQLHTDAAQMLVWGFFVSTVVLFHATVTINSLAHRWGSRRFATRDDSRNNLWLALLTFGEGWHNNHHHFPGTARQGFFWWEVDLTWYGLLVMAALGLVHGLKPLPARVLAQAER